MGTTPGTRPRRMAPHGPYPYGPRTFNATALWALLRRFDPTYQSRAEEPAPMASNITVTFTDGTSEHAKAVARIDWDADARVFALLDDNGETVLAAPIDNLRCLSRDLTTSEAKGADL